MINSSSLTPEIKKTDDLNQVIYDQEWLKNNLGVNLYYIYRNIAENEQDKQKINELGLRYDETAIAGKMLGKEFNKTAGHKHPLIPGTNLTYPEIYEVLEGQGLFLLQKQNEEKIESVYVIKVQVGDKVIVPPNYEHLAINTTKSDLITANIRVDVNNEYDSIKDKRGACYYVLKEDEEIKWTKNENYSQVPPIQFIGPNNFYEFDIKPNQSIYDLISTPEKLDFLKQPQKYNWNLQ